MLKNEFLEKPFGITVEINNVCNAKCSFCGYGKEGTDDRKKGFLDEDVFDHVLELMNNSGGGRLSISPILGEVSVSENWLDLVKKAKQYKNIKLNCYTNGINLDSFGISNILSAGIDSMNISSSLVDKESYKRLYGVDRFDKVIDNILELLRENKNNAFPIDLDIN